MNTRTRGTVTYDSCFGHVCTCTEATEYDNRGNPLQPSYLPTVKIDRDAAPSETGSYFYVCERCGASAWSGC